LLARRGRSSSVRTGSQGRDCRHDMMTRPLPAGEAEDARFELARGCPTAVAEPAREFGVGHDGLRPRDTDCRLRSYTAPGESWLEDGVQHLEQGVQPQRRLRATPR
jgi:hypothetical protein